MKVTAVIDDSHFDGRLHDNKLAPALGLAWANLVTTRILLQRTTREVTIADENFKGEKSYKANVRTMTVLSAPHLPSSLCHFIVDSEGVKGVT